MFGVACGLGLLGARCVQSTEGRVERPEVKIMDSGATLPVLKSQPCQLTHTVLAFLCLSFPIRKMELIMGG